MAKKHEISTDLWTTLEDLLLVYAVERHGPKDWDAIAMEVRNCMTMRNSVPSSLITPQHCRDKFENLKSRFAPEAAAAEEAALVIMVDELRRLRIEELRRELGRHDVSIVSLELKIKRLEEEREQKELDLPRAEGDGGEKMLSPAIVAAKCSAGDESDDRSFNESNTTDQKVEVVAKPRDSKNDAAGEWQVLVKAESDLNDKPNPVQTGTKSFSYRESSSSDRAGESNEIKREEEERKEGGGQQAASGKGVVGKSDELKDSLSKQASETVSFTTKKRRRTPAVRETGEKRHTNDAHPPVKRTGGVIRPEPLMDFIRILRSHRLSSAFERRLRSQESERYRKLIRQHMDMRIIETRIKKGNYAHCAQKFFRDLLLCFNNAILFFRKSSTEHAAAQELRAVVLKKIKDKFGRKMASGAVSGKPEVKRKAAHPAALPKPGRSMIGVCGKRVFTNASVSGSFKKTDKTKKDDVERRTEAGNKKIREDPSPTTHKNGVVKKARNERPSTNGKEAKTNKKSNEETRKSNANDERHPHHAADLKPDRCEKNPSKKKQGAASFLRRMKQNSPSGNEKVDDDDENEDAEERVDDSGNESERGSGSEEEKSSVRKRGGTREVTMTRGSLGRGGSIGRQPLKRAAADATRKRVRDSNVDDGDGGGQPKKRSKR